MTELLFLLLPLAAASGWYAGRRVGKRERQGREPDPAYFKGLNLLLNEQPDKAIDLFIELLAVDSDTFETHLALGSLFRRRGEVDRSIRIHQNLIARPALNRDQRAQALLALGQDYLKAGLYDRAIGLFEELLEQRQCQRQALRFLHQIYQRVRDWDKALVTAARMESLGEPALKVERAHYYCELGQQALQRGDESQGETLIRKALTTDRQSVRASLLLGQLARRRGDDKVALRHFSAIEAQDPGFIGEALEAWVASLQANGEEQAVDDLLRRLLEQYGSTQALLMLADRTRRAQGDRAAKQMIAGFLASHPSLQGLDYLVRLPQDDEGAAELLPMLREIIGRLLGNAHPYQCGQCGFKARKIHWQCPGCGGWGTVKPQSAGAQWLIKQEQGLRIDRV
jgi:lipopolysaccharide assembly protein B